MPAKLKITTTPVKWKIEEEDLHFLRAVYGHGGVNPAVRDLIHAWVQRLRARHGSL